MFAAWVWWCEPGKRKRHGHGSADTAWEGWSCWAEQREGRNREQRTGLPAAKRFDVDAMKWFSKK